MNSRKLSQPYCFFLPPSLWNNRQGNIQSGLSECAFEFLNKWPHRVMYRQALPPLSPCWVGTSFVLNRSLFYHRESWGGGLKHCYGKSHSHSTSKCCSLVERNRGGSLEMLYERFCQVLRKLIISRHNVVPHLIAQGDGSTHFERKQIKHIFMLSTLPEQCRRQSFEGTFCMI